MIHIGGPPGAGKTTLVEALPAGTDSLINAVRCVRDDTLPAPRENVTTTTPEVHRYRAAGAHTTARYAFPRVSDEFFETDVMQDFSHAVILEGDCPIPFTDLTAFVVPADGSPLLIRRESDQPSRERVIDAYEAIISRPGGLESLLGELLGPHIADVAIKLPELMERQRETASAHVAELRSKPAPTPRMRWTVADPYRGIERAQLVMVNIRDRTEQDQAEALLTEVARLRNDPEVFSDLKGPHLNRVPITAVVANLAQPTHSGTKKALARIRRVIRANS